MPEGLELANAYVSLVVEGSKVAPEVRKQFGQVSTDADRTGRTAGKRFSAGFSNSLKGLGGIVAGAFAVDQVRKFVGGAISEASDLGESVNALNVSYGKSSKEIQQLGKEAARSLGLSNTEFNSLAVQFSGFAGTIAGEGGNVVDVLDELSTRGADFASVMNLDVAEAMGLFQSGLAGETEPLRKFGIDLSAAAVEAHAYKEGIAAAGEELTEQQKVQARYSLLMKSTAKTQGDFTNTSDSLANSQRILGAEWDNLQATLGQKLVPVIAELTSGAADFISGMQDGTGAGGEFVDAFMGVKSEVLPPLKELGGLAVDTAQFLSGLPGPVKELGIQAGIAAFVLPKLAAGLTAVQVTGASFAAGITSSTKRTAALGATMRQVAGIGGAVALTQGLSDNEDSLSSWATAVGGGAAAGAALGSVIPGVGTAIGGAAGAAAGAVGKFVSLKVASDDATGSAEAAKPAYDDWASTLDQATGAITRQTRAMILQKLQEDDLLASARNLGITTRDLIDATLGREGAMKRVNNAAKDNVDILSGLELGNLTAFIKENRTALEGQQQQLRQNNRDLTTWGQALKGLPAEARTEIKQAGADIAIKQVRDLARQYSLNPKKLVTQIEAAGVEVTGRKVRGLGGEIKNVGNVETSSKWLDSFISDTLNGKRAAERGANDMSGALRSGTANARPNLNPFSQALRGAIDSLKTTARSGGSGVGGSLVSGAEAAIAQSAHRVVTAAVRMVTSAIGGARNAAKAKSPSRETMRLGNDMVDGLILPFERREKDGKKAGGNFVRNLIRGLRGDIKDVDSGEQDLAKRFGRVTDLIEKDLDRRLDRIAKKLKRKDIGKQLAKQQEKAAKSEAKAMTALVNSTGKALGKIAKQYANHNAELERMRSERASIVSDVAGGITGELDLASAISEPNEFGYGGGQATFSGVASVVSGLAQRARVFADKIRAMLKAGIPLGLVREVQGLGTKQGIVVADALLSGSQAEIGALALDYASINTFATDAGNAIAEASIDPVTGQMYDVGIAAQQGLMAGLLNDPAIAKATKKLSKKLTKKLKKALKSRSPSRLLHDEVGLDAGAGIGEGMVDGLAPYPAKVADDLSSAAAISRSISARSTRLVDVPRLSVAETTGTATAPDPAAMFDRMAIYLTLVPTGRQKAQLYVDGRQAAERFF